LPQPKPTSFRQTGATFPEAEVDNTSGAAEIKSAVLGLASVPSSTLKSIGIAAKRLDFFGEYPDKKAEDLFTYKLGEKIQRTVTDLVGELSPEEQDEFSVKLANGFGQMAGFMGGRLTGKLLFYHRFFQSKINYLLLHYHTLILLLSLLLMQHHLY